MLRATQAQCVTAVGRLTLVRPTPHSNLSSHKPSTQHYTMSSPHTEVRHHDAACSLTHLASQIISSLLIPPITDKWLTAHPASGFTKEEIKEQLPSTWGGGRNAKTTQHKESKRKRELKDTVARVVAAAVGTPLPPSPAPPLMTIGGSPMPPMAPLGPEHHVSDEMLATIAARARVE